MAELLEVLDRAAGVGLNPSTPGYLAFIPGSGLVSAALAGLIGDVLTATPASRSRPRRWSRWRPTSCGGSRDLFDLPAHGRRPVHLRRVAGDVLRAGGRPPRPPAGGLPARHALRHRPGAPLGDQGGPARGLPGRRPCASCPTTGRQRMDVAALRGARRRATRSRSASWPTRAPPTPARSTRSTRSPTCARASGLWLHVDGAYGAAFQLTERGRGRLRGIERADSITLDPHKGFFLPFGTGCLLVRDPAPLRAAHSGDDAHYLQDIDAAELPDFADLGPELTRDVPRAAAVAAAAPARGRGVPRGARREARPRGSGRTPRWWPSPRCTSTAPPS